MRVGLLAKRGLLLAITGVSLYLLAPALLEVFGAFDRLDDFNPLWYVAMVGLQIGSYVCMWMVQKIAVRADHMKPIATSQLASNAFGRIVPGGVAAAGAMQYAMLVRGGVPTAAAASGSLFPCSRSRRCSSVRPSIPASAARLWWAGWSSWPCSRPERWPFSTT